MNRSTKESSTLMFAVTANLAVSEKSRILKAVCPLSQNLFISKPLQ